MMRPLPYPHADRLGQVFGGTTGDPRSRSSLSFDDVVAFGRETNSFEMFGWYRPGSYSLSSPGAPQHVQGAAVTTTLVHNLGVQPARGLWFVDETGAVISSGLWARLGGNPSIVGDAIVLNGRPYTVTGIMPAGFRLPEIGHDSANVLDDVWIALDRTGAAAGSRDGGFFFSYARLKPGVTFAQADADVKRQQVRLVETLAAVPG